MIVLLVSTARLRYIGEAFNYFLGPVAITPSSSLVLVEKIDTYVQKSVASFTKSP